MTNEILGKGWTFPFGTDPNGGIVLSEYEENIKESILLILSTAKGERVMRPDFGCGIHDYVFEVVNTTTTALMKSSIKDALLKFEPRITVQDVSTDADRIKNGLLLINIQYTVISTNNQSNLVYPFYLTEGS
jgi:phage baseplate assembly protein W